MRGTLTFNLPEEQEEFDTVCKAQKYRQFYDELYDKIFRPIIKYNTFNGKEASPEEIDIAYILWEKISVYQKEILE